MHISYISPLSGWYLAQAQPDLTAKNPTHTRLEQLTRLELALSAWKADVLTTNTIAAYKNPAYKALLHHHWRAGNNSGQRRSTNGTQPFYDRGGRKRTRTSTSFDNCS